MTFYLFSLLSEYKVLQGFQLPARLQEPPALVPLPSLFLHYVEGPAHLTVHSKHQIVFCLSIHLLVVLLPGKASTSCVFIKDTFALLNLVFGRQEGEKGKGESMF